MVSLIAISVYSYTKQIGCYAVVQCPLAHSLFVSVWVWKEIETKLEKSFNANAFLLIRNGKMLVVWPGAMHTHSKNYDNKFLVCSNLMSTVSFGRFFRKHFKYKAKQESEKYASGTRRKTTIVKLFPFATSFSSHLF